MTAAAAVEVATIEVVMEEIAEVAAVEEVVMEIVLVALVATAEEVATVVEAVTGEDPPPMGLQMTDAVEVVEGMQEEAVVAVEAMMIAVVAISLSNDG